MAYMVMAYRVMAYIVMAHRVMTYIVMAYIVMAYRVMAYIVMAERRWETSLTRDARVPLAATARRAELKHALPKIESSLIHGCLGPSSLTRRVPSERLTSIYLWMHRNRMKIKLINRSKKQKKTRTHTRTRHAYRRVSIFVFILPSTVRVIFECCSM